MPTRGRRPKTIPMRPGGPFLDMWRALTPAQRLRRAWRLRARLRDVKAIHDAKTLPEL